MKRFWIYSGVSAGAFLIGFVLFYFLMPVIVRHGKVIEVPYLTHMNIKKGEKFLHSLGLKWVVDDSIHSIDVEQGNIVRTIPETGKDVRLGSRIRLIISRGAKKIRIPDIKGLSLSEAEDSLDVYGIVNRVLINLPVEEKEKDGIVIKTKPGVEDSLAKGAKFIIFIGKEKRKVFLMPNLIGLPFDEATYLLTEYKLELAPIRWTESSRNEVLLQSPLTGVEVTFGDTVHLVVGKE